MALTDGDLKKIGNLMDERLLVFSREVTEPRIDWAVEKISKDLGGRIDDLRTDLTNQIQKVERKLDQITDHQAEMLDNHERRIGKLELSVAI